MLLQLVVASWLLCYIVFLGVIEISDDGYDTTLESRNLINPVT